MANKKINPIHVIEEEELDKRVSGVVKLAIEERKLKGLPVQGYDSSTKRAYLLYPDGRKEFFHA